MRFAVAEVAEVKKAEKASREAERARVEAEAAAAEVALIAAAEEKARKKAARDAERRAQKKAAQEAKRMFDEQQHAIELERKRQEQARRAQRNAERKALEEEARRKSQEAAAKAAAVEPVLSRTGRVVKTPAWMAGDSEFAHGDDINQIQAERLPAKKASPKRRSTGPKLVLKRTGRGSSPVPGHLPHDEGAAKRQRLVMDRLQAYTSVQTQQHAPMHQQMQPGQQMHMDAAAQHQMQMQMQLQQHQLQQQQQMQQQQQQQQQ